MSHTHTNASFYGSLTKDAGLGDYLSAASHGANVGTGGSNWALHPIDAASGAVKGILGHVAQNETVGLRNQGIAFNQDPYGRIQDVNIGDSIKNFGSNLFHKAKNTFAGSQEPNASQNNGMGNLMHAAGNFLNQYKMPLAAGLGGSAALLGGGYLLKNLLFPAEQAHPRYSEPAPYSGVPIPGAFQKMGMFGMLPAPTEFPRATASLITNGIDIPGLSGDMQHQHMAKPQEPYNPTFETDNHHLKKTLQNPRMRNYLKNLIQQVDRNRSESSV